MAACKSCRTIYAASVFLVNYRNAGRQIHNNVAKCQKTNEKTIYALASGAGKSAIAVIRTSGSRCSDILRQMTSSELLPEPRKAKLSNFIDPKTKSRLDRGLVLWFPGPASFTGEDMCELHIHGGRAVISAVIAALENFPRVRQAEPGEFTKRAFYNGKMDLTRVEGLADLIHAETEAQRKQALREMDGELGNMYETWRQELLKCLAHVEAYIDFSEDDNIDDTVLLNAEKTASHLADEIQCRLKDHRKGDRLRHGVNIVLVGEPNVGKSSLLNAICKKPVAIVSHVPGTTRDIVERALNLAGYPIVVSDTAGLRNSEDVVEEEGVKRAIARSNEADILLVLLDATSVLKSLTQSSSSAKDPCHPLDHLGHRVNFNSEETCTIIVVNKIDLLEESAKQLMTEKIKDLFPQKEVVFLSCFTNEGMETLLDNIKNKVEHFCINTDMDDPLITQERHAKHLSKCAHHLRQFVALRQCDLVIAAHQLQQAMRQIGKITGQVTTEQILDVIFKEFCIGK